ncbi:MAG: histidine phosphatase family protein [Acidobacteriota bacterium]
MPVSTEEKRKQKWPDFLWILRHAESAGNLARDRAESAGEPRIVTGSRDVDVPLSPLGERQAGAVGRWFGALPADERPTAILSSPYVRALETSRRLIESSGWTDLVAVPDERLREREFGILDGFTRAGIEASFPEEALRRGPLGKFYYRPPGGESWCDVILRLRSVIGTLTREYRGERVMIVCHTVVVLCLRYLLERLTEERLLEIDRTQEVANASITSYAFDPAAGDKGRLVLKLFNFVAPIEGEGAAVTAEPHASLEAAQK